MCAYGTLAAVWSPVVSVSPSGQVYKPFWGEKFTVIRDAEFVDVTDAVDNTTEGSSAHGYVVRGLHRRCVARFLR